MSKDQKQWEAIQEMQEVIKQIIRNQDFLKQLIFSLGDSLGMKFDYKEEELPEGKVRVSGNWVSKSEIIKP